MYLLGGKGRKKRRRMGGRKPNAGGSVAGVRKVPATQSPQAVPLRTEYLWLPEPVTGTTPALWLSPHPTNSLALSCCFLCVCCYRIGVYCMCSLLSLHPHHPNHCFYLLCLLNYVFAYVQLFLSVVKADCSLPILVF